MTTPTTNPENTPKKPKKKPSHKKKKKESPQIDWAQEEHDELLNLWLDGRGLQFISDTLGTNRPVESIENRVWKLATGYGPCSRYDPGPTRITKDGPLTRREIKVIEWGLYGEGQSLVKKRKAKVSILHIVSILNRDIETIQAYCDSKKPAGKGFGL